MRVCACVRDFRLCLHSLTGVDEYTRVHEHWRQNVPKSLPDYRYEVLRSFQPSPRELIVRWRSSWHDRTSSLMRKVELDPRAENRRRILNVINQDFENVLLAVGDPSMEDPNSLARYAAASQPFDRSLPEVKELDLRGIKWYSALLCALDCIVDDSVIKQMKVHEAIRAVFGHRGVVMACEMEKEIGVYLSVLHNLVLFEDIVVTAKDAMPPSQYVEEFQKSDTNTIGMDAAAFKDMIRLKMSSKAQQLAERWTINSSAIGAIQKARDQMNADMDQALSPDDFPELGDSMKVCANLREIETSLGGRPPQPSSAGAVNDDGTGVAEPAGTSPGLLRRLTSLFSRRRGGAVENRRAASDAGSSSDSVAVPDAGGGNGASVTSNEILEELRQARQVIEAQQEAISRVKSVEAQQQALQQDLLQRYNQELVRYDEFIDDFFAFMTVLEETIVNSTRKAIYGSTRITLDERGRVINHEDIFDFDPVPSASSSKVMYNASSGSLGSGDDVDETKAIESVLRTLREAQAKGEIGESLMTDPSSKVRSWLMAGVEDDEFDEQSKYYDVAEEMFTYMSACRLPDSNLLIWNWLIFRYITKKTLELGTVATTRWCIYQMRMHDDDPHHPSVG